MEAGEEALELQQRDLTAPNEDAPARTDSEEAQLQQHGDISKTSNSYDKSALAPTENSDSHEFVSTLPQESSMSMLVPRGDQSENGGGSTSAVDEKQELARTESDSVPQRLPGSTSSREMDEKKRRFSERISLEETSPRTKEKSTLVSVIKERYRWSQETFPTVMAVVSHLPFALVPFAFSMFVLVQALVTKGWVPVFAYGWDHWVDKTGTIGAIGGMGFLSVILCNVSSCPETDGQDLREHIP